MTTTLDTSCPENTTVRFCQQGEGTEYYTEVHLHCFLRKRYSS